LFVYITAEHRKLLTRWMQAALGEDRFTTQSEIVKFALDQASKVGCNKASPMLEERRGRPPTPFAGAGAAERSVRTSTRRLSTYVLCGECAVDRSPS
jgi:hypothetical protein